MPFSPDWRMLKSVADRSVCISVDVFDHLLAEPQVVSDEGEDPALYFVRPSDISRLEESNYCCIHGMSGILIAPTS